MAFATCAYSAVDNSLNSQLRCLVKKIYKTEPELKRTRTIDFLSKKLEKGFTDYKLSRTQKAHFLAQTIHESDGLTATVERRRSRPWWVDVHAGDQPTWDCKKYKYAASQESLLQ